jgi:hypothetical protein
MSEYSAIAAREMLLFEPVAKELGGLTGGRARATL